MTDEPTVHDTTYDLLRSLGMTTVFGNPGSTEQAFLRDFPDDFTYVLALQEASAMAMADGYTQVTGIPALVSLHTAAGTGNAMGNLVSAFRANTPLIVTAGQQTREMLLHDPYLSNRDETILPQPWVKWAYQPVRAEDVPGAFMRAYAVATQPPAGPVFLSVPLDDWDKPAHAPEPVRAISHRVAPDATRLREFAARIDRAEHPLLVFGSEVDRSGGWDAGVALAEKLRAPVYGSMLPDRVSFPEDHPLYAGTLPMTIAEVSETLRGHDIVVVIGAQVFRYYPYVPGDYLPAGTDLLQITANPDLAAVAAAGDSLLGDVRISIEQLTDLIQESARPAPPAPNRDRSVELSTAPPPLIADTVYAALSTVIPDDAVVVNESTSTLDEQERWLPTTRSKSFFATGGGGIGWGVPASVGIALGDRARGVHRTVVATIGDGSFQYSVQAIWTAAQHKLPIVFVVLQNGAYEILKSFALLGGTPGVPGLDLPGLDIVSVAAGFGCRTAHVSNTEELAREFKSALEAEGPSVLVVPTEAKLPHLG